MSLGATRVIVGVDTHRDEHVAVAIDRLGAWLGQHNLRAVSSGYDGLHCWASGLGEIVTFGIEGTGSYGAGLARFLAARGCTIFEVNRPDRSTRRRVGKSDPVDAEMAARSVLAGVARDYPKSGLDTVEMIRMLKIVKSSAMKARTQAMNQMKALIVTAPLELRHQLAGLHVSGHMLEDGVPVSVDGDGYAVAPYETLHQQEVVMGVRMLKEEGVDYHARGVVHGQQQDEL